MIEDEIYDEWVPLNKRKSLSLIRILGIASGNLVPGLLWNVIFTLLEPFVKELGISSTVKTILLLYGSFIGFILGPVLGVASDRLMFKFGRRRIFVIIGGIVVVIALLLMMYCVEIGKKLSPRNPYPYQQATFIIAICLAFTAGNVIQSPARVLCSDVTPISQQNLMSNICQVYSGVASIFSNLLGGLEVYKYTSLEQKQFLLVVSLSIAFAAMLISTISAREEPLRNKPPKVNPFKQIWEAFKKIPKPFSRVIPAFFFANIATYQYQVAFSDFMGSEIMKGNSREGCTAEEKALYDKGVSWSMMSNVMNNAIQLFYGFVNSKVCELIGMKWVMVIGNGLMSIGLLLFFFVSNRFAYLAFTGLIGLGTVIYMAIPYAVVSIVIPTEELGNNLGILNCFCVLGQQVSNFAIGKGLSSVYGNSPRKNIGYSSIFGLLATIASLFILQPSLADVGNYDKIQDESSDADGIVMEFCH